METEGKIAGLRPAGDAQIHDLRMASLMWLLLELSKTSDRDITMKVLGLLFPLEELDQALDLILRNFKEAGVEEESI